METSPTSGASVFPSTTYKKPYLSHDEMIGLLISRGMLVGSRQDAVMMLQHAGYYRLSGYWYSWRQRDDSKPGIELRLDQFLPGCHFEDLIKLYEFDFALRSVLLVGVSLLEVKLRATLAHLTGAHDHYFYLNRESYSSFADTVPRNQVETVFERLVRRSSDLIADSKEAFVEHFRDKYDGMPPIWIAVETWDLGMLATCAEMLKTEWKEEVAAQFGMPIYKQFGACFKTMNHVRNICAHQGRLYRRVIKPELSTKFMKEIPELFHVSEIAETQRRNKLYPALAWIVYALGGHPQFDPWMEQLRTLLDSFPPMQYASLNDYGFPEHWQDQQIWGIQR